jgi:imidazoleglycerol-phosphate dehydratase
MKKRKAKISRKTSETDIKVELNLDGAGKSKVNTGIGFLDHMLTLWARHGMFDLDLSAKGDYHVDYHHTAEDIGICLGSVINEAMGNKKGIMRYGYSIIPMDDALTLVSLDISGRPYLNYEIKTNPKKIGDFPVNLIEEMFRALILKSGITMHIKLLSGKEPHHIFEAIFKGFSKALCMAVSRNPRNKDIPSTKGIL